MLATITAYWPVTHAKFINYDDNQYVTENPMVQQGTTWHGVAWAFTTRHASNWHPLTWLSHMLDWQMFGNQATGPHLVNLALHAANAFLLFFVLRQMTGLRWRSAAVAGFFALHPLHVESVAWVAERKDVLSTFFGFLTLIAYARYAASNSGPEPRRLWGFYFLALAFFALGLMSKPMLVTLPFLLLLLDFWPLQRFGATPLVRLMAEKAPFFIMSAAGSAATVWAQSQAIQPLRYLSMSERIGNVFVAYERYLAKTFWPANLAIPYLHPGQWPFAQIAAAAILVLLLSNIALLCRRKAPFFLTGWFWFLGTLVPVIGLVQVGSQSMADRYTYLPVIGVFIVVVWGCSELWLHAKLPVRPLAAVGLPVLAVCGFLTWRQATFWRDSETLFRHSASVTQDNFIALGNVGGALFEEKRFDEAMDYYQQSHRAQPRYPEALNSIGAILAAQGKDEAIEWFRKALEVQPGHADALFNMGNAMARRGDIEESINFFRRAVEARPDNYEAINNLGNALLKEKRLDAARVQYQQAVNLKPDAPLIRKNLGEILAAEGKLDEAIAQYRAALSVTNDPAIQYSLGMTLAVQGKWDDAIQHYTETIRLSPTNADAEYNLGYALRVKKQLEPAASHLRRATELKAPFPLARYNLACTLADLGRREEATSELRQAVEEEPNYKEAKAKLEELAR